jgi:DNA-binding response OmpR family regulator
MNSAGAPVVLLVDDHDDTREMYAHALRLSAFQVLEAGDGEKGLALATETPPAVVVTDLVMGGPVPATDLCRRFGAEGVPVLVVTGIVGGPLHEEIRAAGCAAVLIKPVPPDTLVAEIRRVLESA